MPRPTSFDRDTALDAALKLFWRRGYTATSLAELLQAMGIARSSFYAAFGDKRSLYLESLQLFGDRTRDILTSAANKGDELGAIRQFFHQTITETPAHRLSWGCMMVNSILELTDVDSGIKDCAQAKLDDIEDEFERLLARARRQGKLPGDHSTRELARTLMTLNLGIRVESRKRSNPAQLQHTIDTSLALFGLAA